MPRQDEPQSLKRDFPRLQEPVLLSLMLGSEAPENEPRGGEMPVPTGNTAIVIPLLPLVARAVLEDHV
jgi:hypothetical protein